MIGQTARQAYKMAARFTRSSSTHSGKVAIVTASSEGIGFEIARRLGHDGAKVVVSSRRQNKVDEACKKLENEGLDVFGMVCHVGKKDDRKNLVNKTLEKYGKIDILVSNAATNPIIGNTLDATEEAWDKIFDTNVKATFLLIKEVVPHMKEQKIKGAITLVSSIAGFAPFPALGVYSISKTALLSLTKVLANELGPDGIRVNCIAPGIIKTNFSKALWGNESIQEELKQGNPLKRMGRAEECAGIVSFLSSDDASYITGENIVVGGGVQSRL
ncbi:dehydrogenase/reductase SDR family member 4-like [Dendronephthya gigantea]|uniref:dehydrogenase/reductase SDR family member 4-like n=1 Tax=Dendronephthya gigantea TaxID=151771 RepID=UPI001069EC61|nr:dehydrogenase/reductase SDR family member 4-like [Dendronephthya gigantea]